MSFNDCLEKKTGYSYDSFVTGFDRPLKFKDVLGPCINETVDPFDSRDYIVLSYSKEKSSPFYRNNEFFLATKDGKLDFCRADYFEIDMENHESQYIIDEFNVIISDVDRFIRKKNFGSKNIAQEALFSRDRDIIIYNFLTKSTLEYKGIGKYIMSSNDGYHFDQDNLLLLDNEGLSIYRVEEQPSDFVTVDQSIIVKDRCIYKDDKRITDCKLIETSIDDNWHDLLGTIFASVYQLYFEDGTTRIVLIGHDLKVVKSNYYDSLKLEKKYIYPPKFDHDNPCNSFPDVGLIFDYSLGEAESGQKINGELLIDDKLDISHRPYRFTNKPKKEDK